MMQPEERALSCFDLGLHDHFPLASSRTVAKGVFVADVLALALGRVPGMRT